MEKVVKRLVEVKPPFGGQMIAMSDQEILIQVVLLKVEKRHIMNLGKSANSLVIKIAEATSDTEPVEVPSVDRHAEH